MNTPDYSNMSQEKAEIASGNVYEPTPEDIEYHSQHDPSETRWDDCPLCWAIPAPEPASTNDYMKAAREQLAAAKASIIAASNSCDEETEYYMRNELAMFGSEIHVLAVELDQMIN